MTMIMYRKNLAHNLSRRGETMTTATYSIQGFREFDQEFPLPALTITGKSGDIRTATQDALFQALNIWWGDNEGWWNGGRHGCGNIRTVIEEVAIS
jgi:hypothetical protein